jgi:hypothetical protein
MVPQDELGVIPVYRLVSIDYVSSLHHFYVSRPSWMKAM